MSDAERDLLTKCKAILQEQRLELRGRAKKTRDELLAELEVHETFLQFQREVRAAGKLKPSIVGKIMKTAESLISKEYKQALMESMQRRARTHDDVIEAVRQEALRKMTHEEDVFFNEAGSSESMPRTPHSSVDEPEG